MEMIDVLTKLREIAETKPELVKMLWTMLQELIQKQYDRKVAMKDYLQTKQRKCLERIH